MGNVSVITSVLILLLGIVLVVLIMRQGRLQREISDNKQQIESLQDELNALYVGAAGVGNHLARIESQLNNVSDRQEQQDVHDPGMQSYSQAIDLIHKGVGIDELMTQCGLLQEEAELLVRLHGSESTT